MVELFKSETFDRWLRDLRDIRAAARIQVRLDRMATGNPGDIKPIGDCISEMRIDFGPGYRVYFMLRGLMIVVLLCGRDISTQNKDIAQAKTIAAYWKD